VLIRITWYGNELKTGYYYYNNQLAKLNYKTVSAVTLPKILHLKPVKDLQLMKPSVISCFQKNVKVQTYYPV